MYNDRMVRILAAFGLTRKSKLPVEGAAPRDLHITIGNHQTPIWQTAPNFEVWIDPVPPEGKKSRFTHRVKARCLKCSQVLSAGRVHQHVCKH